jgi:hypothetical protein
MEWTTRPPRNKGSTRQREQQAKRDRAEERKKEQQAHGERLAALKEQQRAGKEAQKRRWRDRKVGRGRPPKVPTGFLPRRTRNGVGMPRLVVPMELARACQQELLAFSALLVWWHVWTFDQIKKKVMPHHCTQTNEFIGTELGLSAQVVQKALQELKRRGLVDWRPCAQAKSKRSLRALEDFSRTFVLRDRAEAEGRAEEEMLEELVAKRGESPEARAARKKRLMEQGEEIRRRLELMEEEEQSNK